MHDTSRFAAIGLTLTVTCALALAPPAGSSTTGSSRSGNATTGASAAASVSTTTTGNTSAAGSGTAIHYSGGGLLCAGLLESGILGDIFTVAPVSTHREDRGSAIQFAPIWSDSHQATVGNTTQVEPPHSNPAVAIIKLPISFSDADRQKFAAAGWKPHKSGALGISYCLDRTQGMICVTAARD